MADYGCQQIAAETTEKHEHLYHLEHYALKFNFPYKNSGHTSRFHFGDKTFRIATPILTETSLKALDFNGHFITDIHRGWALTGLHTCAHCTPYILRMQIRQVILPNLP